MKRFFIKIWAGWKRFALALARVQLEVILFIFYYVIFMPFGLILRLFRHDPLQTRIKTDSNWHKADIGEFNAERARHQS
ncbi:MAG: hypothetical protein JW763_07465 [candidate division Zixibacteria bacterium]|nr:hypothetical protein [candidate division Zixibacteria bacterium]